MEQGAQFLRACFEPLRIFTAKNAGNAKERNMKYSMIVKREEDVEIDFVRMIIPCRYGDEDIPHDFPQRTGDVWEIKVNVDTGEIIDFPKDVERRVYMKVCDEGSYFLENRHGEDIASMYECPVPKCIPGKYGDYIDFHIKDGLITNWPKKFNPFEFFEDCE